MHRYCQFCGDEAQLSTWLAWKSPRKLLKHIYYSVRLGHESMTLGSIAVPWPLPPWCCSPALLPGHHELSSLHTRSFCHEVFAIRILLTMHWISWSHKLNQTLPLLKLCQVTACSNGKACSHRTTATPLLYQSLALMLTLCIYFSVCLLIFCCCCCQIWCTC